MISSEQIERVEKEFTVAAREALETARHAERDLENYTYYSGRSYDPAVREEKWQAYQEADYQAESRAFIRELIRSYRQRNVRAMEAAGMKTAP